MILKRRELKLEETLGAAVVQGAPREVLMVEARAETVVQPEDVLPRGTEAPTEVEPLALEETVRRAARDHPLVGQFIMEPTHVGHLLAVRINRSLALITCNINATREIHAIFGILPLAGSLQRDIV